MSDGPGDFDSSSAVKRGFNVLWYLSENLRSTYPAEAVLPAFSEYVRGLTVHTVMGLVNKEKAEMAAFWLNSFSAERCGKKLSYDELEKDAHAIIAEAPAGTFD